MLWAMHARQSLRFGPAHALAVVLVEVEVGLTRSQTVAGSAGACLVEVLVVGPSEIAWTSGVIFSGVIFLTLEASVVESSLEVVVLVEGVHVSSVGEANSELSSSPST